MRVATCKEKIFQVINFKFGLFFLVREIETEIELLRFFLVRRTHRLEFKTHTNMKERVRQSAHDRDFYLQPKFRGLVFCFLVRKRA